MKWRARIYHNRHGGWSVAVLKGDRVEHYDCWLSGVPMSWAAACLLTESLWRHHQRVLARFPLTRLSSGPTL